MNKQSFFAIIIVFGILLVGLYFILRSTSVEHDYEASLNNMMGQQDFETLSPEQFRMSIENSDVIIIDVRTPEEYAEGHIKNAINIDFYSDNFRSELEQLDKSQKYSIYCRTDGRSGTVMELMQELGFSHVEELDGGITSWTGMGYSVCEQC